MKRLTAIILAAVLLCALLPLSGAAFTDADKIAAARQEAVEAMSAKGVIAGFPDGSFQPRGTLTRAQAAKIVCVMKQGADGANALTKTDTGFTDVPASHWAAKYVAWCAEQRIVAGVGGGKFNPDGLLSGAAFAKMLTVAFTRMDARTLEGESWVLETQQALRREQIPDAEAIADDPMTREDACYLAYHYLKKTDAPDALSKYTVAAAKKPETLQRPQQADFADANGVGNWQAFNEAERKWYESSAARLKEADDYRGKLDGYLKKSVPVLLGGKEGGNSVCSPLNIYLALAMLAETTDGNTRAQLLSLLGASDTQELRKLAKALWDVNFVDDGVSESLLSSSLWLNQEIEFIQPTLDVLAEQYHASSYRGEMGTKAFNDALQAWLNENTGGLLKEQVKGIETNADTLLTILTAIYLKAPWEQEFSKNATRPDAFHAKGGDKTCDFLHGKAESTVYRGKRFTAASKRLNLGAGASAMWFLLPDEGVDPETLLKGGDAVDFLLGGGAEHNSYTNVRLHLPKFDVNAQTDLIPCLKELGVTDVFVPIVADFTPTFRETDKLKPYVGEAKHAARVKIDEEGVVAAAFTEISILKATAIPNPTEYDFTLDRPFLFAINGADGLPLFVGIVHQPTE